MSGHRGRADARAGAHGPAELAGVSVPKEMRAPRVFRS